VEGLIDSSLMLRTPLYPKQRSDKLNEILLSFDAVFKLVTSRIIFQSLPTKFLPGV